MGATTNMIVLSGIVTDLGGSEALVSELSSMLLDTNNSRWGEFLAEHLGVIARGTPNADIQASLDYVRQRVRESPDYSWKSALAELEKE